MITPAGKVIVVGPVAPFRGGISQHTTLLANALSEISDTRIVSFRRLYPRWLYPGKFQTEETRLTLTSPVEFILDSVNPFSWRKAATYIVAQAPAWVIIPWWTFFLAPCYRYLSRHLRRHGIRVVFFCHNVVDHENSGWKKKLAKTVLRNGTAFVVQTDEEQKALRGLLGLVDILCHPHPIYDQFPIAKNLYPRHAQIELLFYGFIRPYKGLDVLLDALTGLDDLSIHLSIVGEPWGKDESRWRKRIHDTGMADRIEFLPRYATDQETAEYFTRADAVVLPYLSATGTGVVAAAYHYKKPIIASRVGGLKDVVVEGHTGFLVTPGDAKELGTAIRRFATDGIPGVASNIEHTAKNMTWTHLAEQLTGSLVLHPGNPENGR